MTTSTQTMLDTAFKKDVYEGLKTFPKFLSSKYIYDRTGDKLFQDIMNLEEYYLTDCEFEILNSFKNEIASLFEEKVNGFDLIELGAGDGKKTKVLLKHFTDRGFLFRYKPIDISQNAIDQLEANLINEIPGIKVAPEKGEYFEVLERIKAHDSRKKVIMVLGSNIGNLLHPKAIEFLSKLKDSMTPGDILFMGFDLKKDPQTVLDAYNDKDGVTAAFNKNLLHRINRELGGNFNPDKFKHWEVYDPESGTAKSYLVATEPMIVKITGIDLEIKFEAWETIHTEISQKYTEKVIQWLASESGLRIVDSFSDSKSYYSNYAFEKS